MITTPQGNFESDSPFQRRTQTVGMPDTRVLQGSTTVLGRNESPKIVPQKASETREAPASVAAAIADGVYSPVNSITVSGGVITSIT